ncbi:hypothetical protein QUF80_16340 [Desulfococcaceae bacterium HSG8]|nr:hypothetical protein [Desulfococcaceae bacterium HSG8]
MSDLIVDKSANKNEGIIIMLQSERTLTADEMVKAMEPAIRRIIREELERIADSSPGIFRIRPDMPVYQDMLEIRKRGRENNLKFYSHEEVWGE